MDEVTQFQFIGSVEHLHAACLAPVLSALLRAFPFTLHGSDNGSEYVNRVAALLEALHIDEFTKSRARHTNDNALVESKNKPRLASSRSTTGPELDAKGRRRKRYRDADIHE